MPGAKQRSQIFFGMKPTKIKQDLSARWHACVPCRLHSRWSGSDVDAVWNDANRVSQSKITDGLEFALGIYLNTGSPLKTAPFVKGTNDSFFDSRIFKGPWLQHSIGSYHVGVRVSTRPR
jgi:hypothetical protein